MIMCSQCNKYSWVLSGRIVERAFKIISSIVAIAWVHGQTLEEVGNLPAFGLQVEAMSAHPTESAAGWLLVMTRKRMYEINGTHCTALIGAPHDTGGSSCRDTGMHAIHSPKLTDMDRAWFSYETALSTDSHVYGLTTAMLLTDIVQHCIHAYDVATRRYEVLTGVCTQPSWTNDLDFYNTRLRYPSALMYTYVSDNADEILIFSTHIGDNSDIVNMNICKVTGDGLCLLYWMTLHLSTPASILQAWWPYSLFHNALISNQNCRINTDFVGSGSPGYGQLHACIQSAAITDETFWYINSTSGQLSASYVQVDNNNQLIHTPAPCVQNGTECNYLAPDVLSSYSGTLFLAYSQTENTIYVVLVATAAETTTDELTTTDKSMPATTLQSVNTHYRDSHFKFTREYSRSCQQNYLSTYTESVVSCLYLCAKGTSCACVTYNSLTGICLLYQSHVINTHTNISIDRYLKTMS